MLGAEVLVDVLVELLVGAGGLGRVQIASARNVAVGSVEVESAGYGLKLLDWEVLRRACLVSIGVVSGPGLSCVRRDMPLTFMLADRCGCDSLH
jgi:hypothetical protein